MTYGVGGGCGVLRGPCLWMFSGCLPRPRGWAGGAACDARRGSARGAGARVEGGNLAVAIESESDAAQLRAAIKASDGADVLPVHAGQAATFSAENPFNFIALLDLTGRWS